MSGTEYAMDLKFKFLNMNRELKPILDTTRIYYTSPSETNSIKLKK